MPGAVKAKDNKNYLRRAKKRKEKQLEVRDPFEIPF